jgi:hypothetical protein
MSKIKLKPLEGFEPSTCCFLENFCLYEAAAPPLCYRGNYDSFSLSSSLEYCFWHWLQTFFFFPFSFRITVPTSLFRNVVSIFFPHTSHLVMKITLGSLSCSAPVCSLYSTLAQVQGSRNKLSYSMPVSSLHQSQAQVSC